MSVHSAQPSLPPPMPPPALRGMPVSRQPGAIAGILLVVTIGFGLLRSMGYLQGEVASGATLHITTQGFSPSSVSVSRGGIITWINDLDQAQNVASDDYCETPASCLSTGLITKGGAATTIVSAKIAPGLYHAYLAGDKTTQAIINVNAPDVPQSSSVASAPKSSAASSPPPPPPSSRSSVSAPPSSTVPVIGGSRASTPSSTSTLVASRSSSSMAGARTQSSALLPFNPYTVGSTRVHPFDETGSPVDVRRMAPRRAPPARGQRSTAVRHARSPSPPRARASGSS